MSEQSFNFSFSVSQPAGPRQHRTADRVLAWPFEAFWATPHEVLVRIPPDETTHRLRHDEVSVLQRCEPMQTPERHAERIVHDAGGLSRSQLIDMIERLTDRGLLATESGIIERFAGAPGADARKPMTSLFIRSSGRPQALQRALESIVRQGANGAGISDCFVIDDCHDAGIRQQIEKLIEGAAGQTRIRMTHIGPRHRDKLVTTLAAHAGVSPPRLDWFVNGQAGGGQRYGCGINVALLLAAGTRFVLLDDDACLNAVGEESPDRLEAAELTDGHDVRPGFPEPGALQPPFREFPEFAPIQSHAAWLGKTTGEMLAGNAPAEVRPGALTARSLTDMRTGGRVRFTVNGVFGDPGTRSPRWIYCRPAAELGELFAGQARYRKLMQQRWMMRRESRLRAVLDFTLMTTTLTGIDNTSIILPTLPNGAGEDAFLGEVVRFLDPGSLQMGLPWMLRHEPETPRTWHDEDLTKPVSVNPGLFFRHVLVELAEGAGSDDSSTRAGLLKAKLCDLAASEPRELAREIFSQVMRSRTQISALLAQRKSESNLPDYLAHDYRRMIEAHAQAEDLHGVAPGPQVAEIREVAAAYADGMDDWIAAWNTAREVGQRRLVDEILQP